ncbi:hypothetical protein D3C74_484440 [compost metagenome]
MEQPNRYGRARETPQKIAGAIIGINDPTERISGKNMAGFLAPPIAIQKCQQFCTKQYLYFDINLGFVSTTPPATGTGAFSRQ